MKNINLKTKYTFILLLMIFIFSGCADVSPHTADCITSSAYGFWSGLWHGVIILFSWIGSLFNGDIAIYAYNNNGGWYDFGFILGAGAVIGSSSSRK